MIAYKQGLLQTTDPELEENIEAIASLYKLDLNLNQLKSCEYLTNLADYSLSSMCDSGLSNYYMAHFGLIFAFFGFVIQFFGNYYGYVYLELNFSLLVIFFLIFIIIFFKKDIKNFDFDSILKPKRQFTFKRRFEGEEEKS